MKKKKKTTEGYVRVPFTDIEKMNLQTIADHFEISIGEFIHELVVVALKQKGKDIGRSS